MSRSPESPNPHPSDDAVPSRSIPPPDCLDEHIIRQSLDFRDWLPQIQAPQARSRLTAAPLGQSSSALPPRPVSRLGLWLQRLIGFVRQTTTIEFQQVEYQFQHFPDRLWGGHIDSPRPGDRYSGTANADLAVRGWALGKESPVVAVRLAVGKTVLLELPVEAPRPDVLKAYFFVSQRSDRVGFEGVLNLTKLPPDGELSFLAVGADGQTAPIGYLQLTRY